MSNGFDDFYAIIPAGGTGTRLWPLSREAKPKFLFDLLGSGRTLIQSTFDRLAAIAGMGQCVHQHRRTACGRRGGADARGGAGTHLRRTGTA